MLQHPESFVEDPPDEKKESMQTVWRVISDVITNIQYEYTNIITELNM